MSGGRLVVLDRLGRDVKAFPLQEGLATIGSDPVCDIRVMLPAVSPHHATVAVHTNQTIVRSVSAGETLVNGLPVSVAALRHGDELGVGGRRLRWEYAQPARPRPLAPQPALAPRAARPARARRRGSEPPAAARPAPPPRASAPPAAGRQVAVVQPQRRHAADAAEAPRSATKSSKRSRASRNDERDSNDTDGSTRKSPWAGEARRTPLRHAALRAAHRRRHAPAPAAPAPVAKIQAPAAVDHTKQAAIMLMTGHTPRAKLSPRARPPSFLVKKPSPVRGTPGPGRRTPGPRRTTPRPKRTRGTSILEATDSDGPAGPPAPPSPKKSALKDPSAKRSARKTESIKFDLSNLESGSQDRSSDVLFITETTGDTSYTGASGDDLSLRYSDTSGAQSPSPRKSIHSRSGRILEKSLGTTFTRSASTLESATSTPESPRNRQSLRGSLIVQRALENSNLESSGYSRRSTRSLPDRSYGTALASARGTTTPSPRSPARRPGSYSVVDLVSAGSDESGRSEYGSAASASPRRSAAATTPENSTKFASADGAGLSRASRSHSRISAGAAALVGGAGASPRTSRRGGRARSSAAASPAPSGSLTPIGRRSPEEATTPVLSIRSLLDQSALGRSSSTSRGSRKTTRGSSRRKTVGANISPPKKIRTSVKSKSLNLSSRRSLRARKLSESINFANRTFEEREKVETPRSAVKLVQEGVKNKHSTAKKPTSKRSIIDNLDESDFVKQLFNSPVKRKLSQSMTEFSRKQLFDDDNVSSSRPTRKTTALTGRTPENSFANQSEAFTPEVFVSPLSTPGNSPNLSGIKRLFAKSTPENDLRNVRGVKALLRTPRVRKSVRNDLSDVSGVKRVFAGSPRNRLSDVRVKEAFASSPKNDLRRVSGVKALFRSTRKTRTPKNTLEDFRGVKNLFGKSPTNDLRRVSGAKRALRVDSPRNDLTDVSGVRRLFREPPDLDACFDRLLGRPRVRSYGKSKSVAVVREQAARARGARSLHDSIGLITANVEEWLQSELRARAAAAPLAAPHAAPLAAHALPLKKRSLAGPGAAERSRLPLKKRSVVHSTPVKGRGAALDASELGRVSPIAADDARATRSVRESPKAKKSKARTTQMSVPAPDDVAEPSPRRTRGAGRAGLAAAAPATTARRRRSSVVIARKPPVMSPKPARGTKKPERVHEVQSKKSPKKTRSTRQKSQVEEKVKTPRKTRAKTNSKSVSSAKPAPRVTAAAARRAGTLPAAGGAGGGKEPRRGRRAVDGKKDKAEESKPVNEKRTRKTTSKNETKSKSQTTVVEEQAPARRSRKNQANQSDKSLNKRPRVAREKVEKQASAASEPTRATRGRAGDTAAAPEPSKRQRKITVTEDSKRTKAKSVETAPRKSGRGTRANENEGSEVKKKVDSDNSVQKGRRGRKHAVEVPVEEPQAPTGRRNKKTAPKEEIQVKSVRGRKTTVAVEEAPKPAGRKRKTKIEESVVEDDAKKRRTTRAGAQAAAIQRTASRSRRR